LLFFIGPTNRRRKDATKDFTNHGYTGTSQQWYQCDGTQASFYDAVVHGPNGGPWIEIEVILSTDADLPKKKTRVAQIDVAYTGAVPPKFTIASSLIRRSRTSSCGGRLEASRLVLTARPVPGRRG